jgi:hypothetical protein
MLGCSGDGSMTNDPSPYWSREKCRRKSLVSANPKDIGEARHCNGDQAVRPQPANRFNNDTPKS